MRSFIPALLMLVAACGSAPTNDNTASAGDSATQNSSAMTTETAPSGANQLTADEQNNGWKLLFDGKTKSGWHSYNNKGTLAGWIVKDESLYLDSLGLGEDAVTDGEYENFHLKVDWKISHEGNSGIIFGVNEDKKYLNDYMTGPEMQVLDNKDASDAKNPKHRAGDLYDLISANPETAHPAGEWNFAEIYKNKDSLIFYLNGTAVVRTKMWDDNWKKNGGRKQV